jgi:hypothetical protein
MGARTVITTLVTSATAPSGGAVYDLTTLEAVKTELNITSGAEDAYFRSAISRASAAAAQFCDRVFPQETVKDEFWAQRDPVPCLIPGTFDPLHLTRWPIISVTTVIENDVTLVDGTDFRVDYINGRLTRMDASGYPRAWPSYPIAVTYAAGYATIPYDVVDAVIRMVKSRWFMRTRDATVRQQNIPGVLEQTFWIATGNEAGAITPDIVDLLDGYRVPIVKA